MVYQVKEIKLKVWNISVDVFLFQKITKRKIIVRFLFSGVQEPVIVKIVFLL